MEPKTAETTASDSQKHAHRGDSGGPEPADSATAGGRAAEQTVPSMDQSIANEEDGDHDEVISVCYYLPFFFFFFFQIFILSSGTVYLAGSKINFF